jgi:hypothetical protein
MAVLLVPKKLRAPPGALNRYEGVTITMMRERHTENPGDVPSLM